MVLERLQGDDLLLVIVAKFVEHLDIGSSMLGIVFLLGKNFNHSAQESFSLISTTKTF